MGVREIDGSLEQWHMGVKDLRRRIILAPDTPGAGEVVRHAAAGAGLNGSGHGGGSGKGPTHHRAMGFGLRRGRTCGPDIRAGRWFPTALDEVRRRCRTVLQSRAEALLPNFQHDSYPQVNAHPTLALV